MEFKTNQDLASCLESQSWIFAKTMPNNPHFYTLKKNWQSSILFESAVIFLRQQGVKEMFRGWSYICFNFNGYKYWTMGEPISQTVLINRKQLEILF